MGAINNAFNQAAGAVAGAALAVKHAQESDFTKMNAADHSALIARNQSREADAAAYDARVETEGPGGLKEQADEAEKKAHKAAERAAQAEAMNKVYPSLMNKGKAEKRAKEFEEAKKALEFLIDSIHAKTDVIDRAIEQRRYAEKATKMALDEKIKYEKRWGGIK
jgi:hypothetical protein